MNDELFDEYQKMMQAHLEHALRELAEVVDQEIEESPDKYFGVGIYGDD
jgi:hypothetical protein